MSALFAVWIDSGQAKLFRIDNDETTVIHLRPHGPRHRAESLGLNHIKAEGDTERFYHEVAEYLARLQDSCFFVIGSGLGRTHLVRHIQNHHPKLAKSIVGHRPSQHQTDNQIRAQAREFFVESGLLETA